MKNKALEFVVQKMQTKATEKVSDMLKKLAIDPATAQQQQHAPPGNLEYSSASHYPHPLPNTNLLYPPPPFHAAPNTSASYSHLSQQNAALPVSATYPTPPPHSAGPPPGASYGLPMNHPSHEQPPPGHSPYPQPSYYQSSPPPVPAPVSSSQATDPPSAPEVSARPTYSTPKLHKLPPAAYHTPPHPKVSPAEVPEDHLSSSPYQSPYPQPPPRPTQKKPSTSHASASVEGHSLPSQSHYPQPPPDHRLNVCYPQPTSHQPTTSKPAKKAKRPAKAEVTHSPTSHASDQPPEGYPSAPVEDHRPSTDYGPALESGSPLDSNSPHNVASQATATHLYHHHHYQHVELTSDTYISQCPFAENPTNQDSEPSVSSSLHISEECNGNGVNVIPIQNEQPSEAPELLMEELLDAAFQRQGSAMNILGSTLLDETRKGLSRVIDLTDEADINLFSIQLRRMDFSACESDYRRGGRDGVPCFALSYAHEERMVGRFPFSTFQWENFVRAMNVLASSGVQQVRLWLDQCLWLRDANLACWAHTGIVPYVIWPVISLGKKISTSDRTLYSYERVWPFLEEVAGLWSMGVLTFCETSQDGEALMHTVHYNQRTCLDLEVSILAVFHNICEGALDELHCSCQEDVMELMDMAKFNMDNESEDVIIGGNWRSRIAPVQRGFQRRPFKSSLKNKYMAIYSVGTVHLD